MSCSKCKKKSMIVFNCRCGKEFCTKHKQPEDHNCTFDFKNYGKEKIKINNPKVTNNKFNKNELLLKKLLID